MIFSRCKAGSSCRVPQCVNLLGTDQIYITALYADGPKHSIGLYSSRLDMILRVNAKL